MIRKALIMKAYPSQIDEYIKRHNEIWQEMKEVIYAHGCKSYSIFAERKTGTLFAYLEVDDEKLWAKTALTEINQKWWEYMAPIMETNPDNSPTEIQLEEAFHLEFSE